MYTHEFWCKYYATRECKIDNKIVLFDIKDHLMCDFVKDEYNGPKVFGGGNVIQNVEKATKKYE